MPAAVRQFTFWRALPTTKAVAVTRDGFDRWREGTKLLSQRPDDSLDFVRTREGRVPDFAKHLVASHHTSARADQAPYHPIFQARRRRAPAIQDELAIGFVEP